jgi:nitroreductase
MGDKLTPEITAFDHGKKKTPRAEPRLHARQAYPRIDSKNVPSQCVKHLFELARLSPTEWYFQPWRWIVVQSEAGKRLIASSEYLDAPLASAPIVLICLADTAAWKTAPQRLLDLVAEKKISEDDARGILRRIREYYSASPLRVQRAALAHAFVALHQILLAAAECHLSAYWVSAFDEQKIKTHFHVPDRYLVAALLAIGDGEASLPPAHELPLESLVYSEKFGESYFPAPSKKPASR